MTANSFLGISHGIWAALAFAIAIVYFFYSPRRPDPNHIRPTWRLFILRWFHSLVWVLVGISFLIRMAFGLNMHPATGVAAADGLAFLGLVVYIVFMAVMAIDAKELTR